jgi:uncharacterized membrane protein
MSLDRFPVRCPEEDVRIGFVVVGVVLIILAAVLMFVPIVTVASQTITPTQPYEANVTGYSITGSIPGSISWSSSSDVEIDVATCSSVSSANACSGSVNALTPQNGTSGTFTFNVPTGGAVAVALVGAGSASITVKLAQSTVGLILLVVGILLLLIGLVLKRSGSKTAPVMAEPAQTPPPPAAPP